MHLRTWESTTKREQVLLMSSHPSTNTSPWKKSQVMGKADRFSASGSVPDPTGVGCSEGMVQDALLNPDSFLLLHFMNGVWFCF